MVVYMPSRTAENAPALSWKYQTGGSVLFSAAYKDGTVYFASNDSYAYALNVRDGALVWKSPKLPGAGFYAWWPVVYENQTTGADAVILAGSDNYRFYLKPGFGDDLMNREIVDVFPDRATEPRGTLMGSVTLMGRWTLHGFFSTSRPSHGAGPISYWTETLDAR